MDAKPRIRVRTDRAGAIVSAIEAATGRQLAAPARAAGLSSGELTRPPGQTTGFEAGAYGRRMGAFTPSRAHVNALLAGAGPTIMARARFVRRNIPYARNGVDAWIDSGWNTGIHPVSRVPDPALKSAIMTLFYDWAEECGAEDGGNLISIGATGTGDQYTVGGCFLRLRPRRLSDGLAVPLQLQLLPYEQLAREVNDLTQGGGVVRQGIEFDGAGTPVAYHFYRNHPGDWTATYRDMSITRVPASEVIHLYDPEEPGQIMGYSELVAAIVRLFQADAYDDAELDRKKVAAMIAGFVKINAPGEMVFEKYADLWDPSSDMALPEINLQPGTLLQLLPGQDVQMAQGVDVGGQFSDFKYDNGLLVSAAMGMPYSLVTGDLRGANYSSNRLALVFFGQRLKRHQTSVLIPRMMRPIWRAFMDHAVMAGKLDIRGYASKRREFQRVDWMLPDLPWVDPLKDTQAEVLAMEKRLTSRSAIIRSRGRDPEQVDKEIAEDEARLRALGVQTGPFSENIIVTPSDDAEDKPAEGRKRRAA